MLIVVRHGSTDHNSDDGGGEKTRGHLPIPLSLDGMKESRETAESLGSVEDVSALYTSDLVRAVQSAEEIAQVLSMEIEPREELRDWDIGDHEGLSVKSTLPHLHALIDTPKKKAPGGEAYQDFLDRSVPFIKDLVESKNLYIAVTHNRVTTLISALAKNKGDHPATATLKSKGPIDPGGILILGHDWSIKYTTGSKG